MTKRSRRRIGIRRRLSFDQDPARRSARDAELLAGLQAAAGAQAVGALDRPDGGVVAARDGPERLAAAHRVGAGAGAGAGRGRGAGPDGGGGLLAGSAGLPGALDGAGGLHLLLLGAVDPLEVGGVA